MSNDLTKLKEVFATGQFELDDLYDLRELIFKELKNNRLKKPHSQQFNNDDDFHPWYVYDWYKNIRSSSGINTGKTDMVKEYVQQKPSSELQEITSFTLQVVKNFQKLYQGGYINEIDLLAPLAREPHLTKPILRFAKENNIGATTDNYPDKLIQNIARLNRDIVESEQITTFETTLVYKNLLGFIIDEARFHRENPQSKAEAEMFYNLETISAEINNMPHDKTIQQMLDQRSYDAFREIAADKRHDIKTLRNAQRFLGSFIRNCHDEELEYKLLKNIIPVAAECTSSNYHINPATELNKTRKKIEKKQPSVPEAAVKSAKLRSDRNKAAKTEKEL